MYKQHEYSIGEGTIESMQPVDECASLHSGCVEPMTFREKLLHDREQDIKISADQHNCKSSARLPQKKRLSLGIMGRVAAFNKGEFVGEHKPKPPPPRQAPKLVRLNL